MPAPDHSTDPQENPTRNERQELFWASSQGRRICQRCNNGDHHRCEHAACNCLCQQEPSSKPKIVSRMTEEDRKNQTGFAFDNCESVKLPAPTPQHIWGDDLTADELHHLSGCGITEDWAQAAKWRDVDSADGRSIVGRAGSSDDFNGILIPYYWPAEEYPRNYRLRLANPPLEERNDGTVKAKYRYLSPPGARNMLYFPQLTDPQWLDDVSVPIVVVEGEKKCLALAALAWHGLGDAAEHPRFLPVGLSGVWSWKGTIGKQGGPHGERQDVKGVIPDFGRITWTKRRVILLYDCNVCSNENVRIARNSLAATLRRRDADVLFADIPPDLGVNGIDDVAGQHGAERALEIIHSAYEPVIEPRKLTDLGNAERLVDRHGDCFRWSEEFGCWFVWNGQYWERDHKRQVNHWAREVVRASNLEASDLTQRKARLEAQLATQTDGEQDSKLREEIEKLDKRAKPIYAWAKKSEASARIRGLVDLARSEDGVPVLASELDTHPLLFPVENCTIDLETGKARPHQREDLLTMISPVRYVEGAECQRWLQYLNEVFRQYPDIPSWLQRAVGSCLTGLIREHVFFQLYGEGRNGKSTSLHVMEALLGDYAITVPFAVFTEASRWRAAEAPQPFLVRFRGVRFVCAQEPKEGAVFNEELIKTITGGDTISARTLHEKPIEFLPTHKVWLSGNHKPEIHGTDLGIWSRPRLIPFSEQFPEGGKTTDPNLVNALLKELPGILNWAIEGCLLWLKEGLGTCATVKAATDQYRKDEDILKPWIENCCDVMYGNTLRARRGYESFSNFLGGKAPISEKAFAGRMRIKGFVKDDDMYGAFYRGIGLNQRSTSDQSTINSKVNSPGG